MFMHPMGSKDIAVNHVKSKVVRIRQKNDYTEERREEIIKSYQERSSLRGLTRTFGVSRNTVKDWLKKAATLPPLRETLIAPDPDDPDATIMELDELWSFALKKRNTSWIWITLCRKTRQVIARVIGDRSKGTCLILWENIPNVYRSGQCFSDFCGVYQAIIPEQQLTQVGKETGETAHVERWNCTLRQRLGRFVRKTLSFSKSDGMHIACLDLFLHRYNLEKSILLN